MTITFDSQKLNTYVKWYIEHGRSPGQTFDRAFERFGRYSSVAVSNAIGYWTRHKNYAASIASRKDNTQLARLRPPSQTGGTENLRVQARVIFNDPSIAGATRRRTAGFTYDLKRPTTLGDLKDEIRQLILEWARKHYSLTPGAAAQRVSQVQIVGLETL